MKFKFLLTKSFSFNQIANHGTGFFLLSKGVRPWDQAVTSKFSCLVFRPNQLYIEGHVITHCNCAPNDDQYEYAAIIIFIDQGRLR